jgi:RNA recognition motif-containing protein
LKSIFVGNLPWTATEDEIKAKFAEVAPVLGARIITDKMTGRSKGFGFVDVEDNDMEKAIALNGTKLGERELVVNEARKREAR